MKKDFESIEHTADIQIRVYGDSLQELFVHALVGMFQSIGPHAKECEIVEGRLKCKTLDRSHSVEVMALDKEALLVDFLSEALYLSDVNNEAYLAATIDEISDTTVKATIKGVEVTGFDVVEIKAVTYHGLVLKKINGGWQADIVFDI